MYDARLFATLNIMDGYKNMLRAVITQAHQEYWTEARALLRECDRIDVLREKERIVEDNGKIIAMRYSCEHQARKCVAIINEIEA